MLPEPQEAEASLHSAAVVVRVAGKGALDPMPGVAGGVLGLIPRQRGRALGLVPTAPEALLDVVPALADVRDPRLPTVAIGVLDLRIRQVVPLAVLVGAIVVYGILSLSLILSGVVDLIDRARVRRQATGMR